jgi:hypothetical protein
MLRQVRATSVSRGGWSIRLASFGSAPSAIRIPPTKKTKGQRTGYWHDGSSHFLVTVLGSLAVRSSSGLLPLGLARATFMHLFYSLFYSYSWSFAFLRVGDNQSLHQNERGGNERS